MEYITQGCGGVFIIWMSLSNKYSLTQPQDMGLMEQSLGEVLWPVFDTGSQTRCS